MLAVWSNINCNAWKLFRKFAIKAECISDNVGSNRKIQKILGVKHPPLRTTRIFLWMTCGLSIHNCSSLPVEPYSWQNISRCMTVHPIFFITFEELELRALGHWYATTKLYKISWAGCPYFNYGNATPTIPHPFLNQWQTVLQHEMTDTADPGCRRGSEGQQRVWVWPLPVAMAIRLRKGEHGGAVRVSDWGTAARTGVQVEWRRAERGVATSCHCQARQPGARMNEPSSRITSYE